MRGTVGPRASVNGRWSRPVAGRAGRRTAMRRGTTDRVPAPDETQGRGAGGADPHGDRAAALVDARRVAERDDAQRRGLDPERPARDRGAPVAVARHEPQHLPAGGQAGADPLAAAEPPASGEPEQRATAQRAARSSTARP